jgi:NAD-dependent dihydropyrimidine dehydrogenase PreA subunit
MDRRIVRTVVLVAALVGLVVAGSLVSNRLWGGKPEAVVERGPLRVEAGMTVAQFGTVNNLPEELLKEVFGLKAKADLERKVGEFGLADAALASKVEKALAFAAQEGSKNWVKILLKFVVWFAFLGMVFTLMRRGRITPRVRKRLYLGAALLFGVILGSDPSPMGTVKDAVVLLGKSGIIFPPRMIALTVFLALVVAANKFICAWGCQVGTLQDLIFRLGRDDADRKGILRQFKLPFAVTNSVRIIFFAALTLAAFGWATDIVEPIDPFRLYNPTAIGLAGGIFAGAILIAGLFVYRPWCHLLCPFGLVGWLAEKISVYRIRVNYDTCIACRKCEAACPSTVMGAILTREKKTIPDCFACGTCLTTCPTGSVRFDRVRRELPPAEKFKKKTTDHDEARKRAGVQEEENTHGGRGGLRPPKVRDSSLS